MTLLWVILIPLAAGVLAWLLGRVGPGWARGVCLAGLAAELFPLIDIAHRIPGGARLPAEGRWLAELSWAWIPRLGIRLHLAADGLSLALAFLTVLLGIAAVVASWTEIRDRVGFFHFQLMWVLAGVLGVFLALDLFLFYFFWELMLIPMYFLIAIWGHANRTYAAVKFFLFTQLSGLLMLVAIVALYFLHYRITGIRSFDYSDLLGTPIPGATQMWLMLGFFAAFAVKLPVVPLHTWLPDAHTEAPTAGSVVLAGLLLKTGAYGLIRFALPLFPDASRAFSPVAMALGAAGILYGAAVAFSQTDLKRMVAYTSVSHLGFVLLGIYAWNAFALHGAVLQMVCHGISTGALFILVGALQERIHTRELSRMGGLWETVPRMGGVAMFFAMASLGLPGLGNFVAEFLVLSGAYRTRPVIAAVATAGLVAAAAYSLRLVQQAFHGKNVQHHRIADLGVRDMAVLAVLIVSILWLGLFPQPLIDLVTPALQAVGQAAAPAVLFVGR